MSRALSRKTEAIDSLIARFRPTFALDLRSLAVCRMAVGLMVIGDLLSRGSTFRLHYTDLGILPREALYTFGLQRFPSLYSASSWGPYLVALFLCHGGVALLLALGYQTRLTGALTWYFTVALQGRNFLVNNGGDPLLASVLFWGMFLPWGEVFSLDRVARRRRGEPELKGLEIYSGATVVFVLQPLMIYWVSVFHKMEPVWLSGDVLYYAFQNDLYSYPFVRSLLPHTEVLKFLTYATLAWEFVGPFFLLSKRPRLRLFACLVFVLMHLNFGLFLRLGLFAFSPTLYLIALLPAFVWTGARTRRIESFFRELGRRTSRLSEPRPTKPLQLGRDASYALCVLFFYVVLIAVGQDPRVGRITPKSFEWVAHVTGLYQRWSVFVNLPKILDGWLVVEATTADGRKVDLFQGNDPVDWEKPSTPLSRYNSFRWPTPIVVVTADRRLQPFFVRALVLDWERGHPEDHIVKARYIFMTESTKPNFEATQVQRVVHWEGDPR